MNLTFCCSTNESDKEEKKYYGSQGPFKSRQQLNCPGQPGYGEQYHWTEGEKIFLPQFSVAT